MALFPQREYYRYLLSSLVLVVCSYATMLVDAAVGGHFLGEEAVSAVNLAMPISEIFYAFTLLLGIGSSIKASIDIGRNDIAQVRRTFTTAVTSTFAGLLLLAIIFWGMRHYIIDWLTAGTSLKTMTYSYLYALLPWFVIGGTLYVLRIFTTLSGKPELVMRSAILQFIVNICCNTLFLGLFHWGIWALAVSSLISAMVMGAILLANCSKSNCPFRLIRCSPSEYKSNFLVNCHYGIGLLTSNISYSIFVLMMNALVLRLIGEKQFYIWSVIMMIFLTASYIIMAGQETCITMGGRYTGLGMNDVVRRIHKRTHIILSSLILLIIALTFLFPNQLMPFFGVSNPEMNHAILPVLALSIPFVWFNNILSITLLPIMQKGKIWMYTGRVSILYLHLPLLFVVFHYLLPGNEWWCFISMIPIQAILLYASRDAICA